ncbi:MAG TPA: AMP-binding protein, partial [Pyrinomonadaceae bacterium]|nr:AMP-binding protein [Pyrinomonadaceae bacterium]
MDSLTKALLSRRLEREEAFWLSKLGGDTAASGIPLDYRRPEGFSGRAGRAEFDLDAGDARRLLAAVGDRRPLAFAPLLTALKLCLSAYAGAEDVTVGAAIHERHAEDAALNRVVALRDRVRPGSTLRELLQDVQRTLHEAYKNQKFPFERVLELLGVGEEPNRAPLFDVVALFGEINNPENVAHLKNDVTVVFSVADERVNVRLEYNEDLYRPETFARFAAHFGNALRALLDRPDAKVSEAGLLSEDERRELTVGFNDTAREYPAGRNVHELFEEQAARVPERVALVHESAQLNYAELNARANRLARHLRSLGVGAESRVGVFLERSAEAIVSLLAVLKAGGAYVPLDPSYPRERLSFMSEDTGVRVILTSESLAGRLPETDARVVRLDSEREEIASQSAEDLPATSTPDNLAYVIYTSGSTGRPKGVMVTHRAVVRLVRGANYVELTPDECVLQFAPLAFDASTFEIWGALLNGARLAVMPAGQPSLEELGRAVGDYKVTTMWLTAGLFHLMVDHRLTDLLGVRQLLAGGDVLSPPHVSRFLRAAPGSRLINGYGPTENTTFTCCHPLADDSGVGASVPIGRPIANTRAYVLDA